MTADKYEAVTELGGEEITSEQLFRLCNRYFWAGQFCEAKAVVELACGTGPGLGHLGGIAESVVAGDISNSIVARAKEHYGRRFEISVVDAADTQFIDGAFDVVILFEALYYLANPDSFVQECRRILRPGGVVLISSANKDLFDFSPSPHSYQYHGVLELNQLFERNGFSCEFYGSTPVQETSFLQRLLRPVKAAAVRFNLMPKSMAGKKLLKRLIFGAPTQMPLEVKSGMVPVEYPAELACDEADRSHKVIYCKAKLVN